MRPAAAGKCVGDGLFGSGMADVLGQSSTRSMSFTPMKFIWSPAVRLATALALSVSAVTHAASVLDTNGVTLLRATTTNLNGAGIRIAQPEASSNTNTLDFQINPADGNVAQPVSLFTYESSLGTATNYPNSVGVFSGHATQVASSLFGRNFGVATNLSHVDNYDADYFISTFIDTPSPPDPGVQIVNQSFIFGPLPLATQQSIDSDYDDSAAAYNILFVSGAGNSGPISAPATCYNGLGVAAFGGPSSFGPTPDNSRCKPDLTAPASATSFSTPQVAGAAALLWQAGTRGDGGSDTNSATKIQTIKALLLNGAVKPANWTNAPATPLDLRHGAGVLNVFNSWKQLTGGKHTNIASITVPTGDAHLPTGAPGTVNALSGWDCTTLSSSMPVDRINHYYFNVTNGSSDAPHTLTATLVWNRQQNESAINDLDLYLYDTANSNLVAESTSFVNNVEHLYVPVLPPGRYDLQVWKAGGNPANGNITSSETYALAWEFFVQPLAIAGTETNVTLRWPAYPDGFRLQSTTNLVVPGTWMTLTNVPTVSTGTNVVTLPTTNGTQFFRLKRPMF